MCLGLTKAQKAAALTGSEFKAGNIIADTTFYNGEVLSSQDIQSFLNAKVPSCDTNGTQASSHWYDAAGRYYTRAEWGGLNGYPAPFTCLRNYTENTPTKIADSYCAGTYTGGNKSAAQIIRDVGVACGISQKALIVLLQKEQSLVTDDWPWSIQYRSATGYGCPDTAACDSTYYGFFNQVYNAARQFQRYSIESQLFNYKARQTSYIQYNPNASCGGTNVYIENAATAALYNYTPYQPNTSALNNLYGSGDACGAYGNRNFWRMFNDWFGSTTAPPFAWSVVSNKVYDQYKYTEIDTGKLRKGERIFISLKVRNSGTEIWYRDGPNPITLGTALPYNHISPICDSTWLSCSRVTKTIEAAIAPGEEGHFEFYAKAPGQLGELRDYLAPVLENRAWMQNDTGYHLYVKSNNELSWQWKSYDAWSDQARTIPIDTNQLSKGQYYYITLKALNSSASIWSASGPNPVSLGTFRPLDRKSVLCSYQWINCTRPALMNEATVAPGQIASFSFLARAPYTNGAFREYFKPVSEYSSWMSDDFNHIYGNVVN